MRNGDQIIARQGQTNPLTPIPSGARVRIDPDLIKGGLRVVPNWIFLSQGFLVASINPDGTFDAQNISSDPLVCAWFAVYEHSIQHNQRQEVQSGLGPLGVLPSPLPPISLPFGEVNDGQNIGGGAGIFAGKVGTILDFKSLVAGAGITLNAGASEIEIVNAGAGYTGPQTPLTTGAFAHYPLQEGQGANELVETINANNCLGSVVSQVARHPIFPARTMLRFSAGLFTSLIDAGFGSVDQTIEAIVYPGGTGAGQLWYMQGASVSNVAQWDGGAGRYTYSWQGLGALSTPSQYYFPGKDGTLAPEAAPYLLRVSRRNNGGTMEVTTYKDGYAVLPVLTTAVIPPLADRIILGNNCPVWMSDLTIWNTATPPVSALDQARRVKPWLF